MMNLMHSLVPVATSGDGCAETLGGHRKVIMKLRMALISIATLCFVSCGDSRHSPTTNMPDSAVDQPMMAQYTAESLSGLEYNSDSVEHYDSQGRVKVETSSAWSEEETLIVRATFSPEEGYHLYSSALPRSGIDGLGRPTLVEVKQSDEFAQVGPLISDKETKELPSDPRFQVFPAGPVTLFLPIHFSARPQVERTVALTLTYMACSEQTCYRPIERVPIEIRVSAPPST